MNNSMRILLVTEELSNIPPSGGIGAAFLELAQALARSGHAVDLLYVPAHHAALETAQSKMADFADQGIRLVTPDFEKYVHEGADYSKKTYTVYRTIQDLGLTYDTIHFHDFKGLGFATQEAKRCGLDFETTTIVVQLHGPTSWTIDANQTLFTHPDQLRVDHMERCSIEWADQLVSPSQYLLDWLEENDFDLPEKENRHVIPNVITGSIKRIRMLSQQSASSGYASEIIMFGRHEERKGLINFLKAIQILDKDRELDGVRITLLGGFSQVGGRHSGMVITDMMKALTAEVRVIPNFGRSEAMQYLAERNGSIVVIPSPVENLPYTVMEAIALGKPTLSTKNGGGPEMVSQDQHESHLFDPTPEGIAETLRTHLNASLVPTRFARPPEQFEQDWLEFHSPDGPGTVSNRHPVPDDLPTPRVTFGITHYERPRKLLDAVWTAIRQDYPNLEIIVVDDGSKSEEAQKTLKTVETILDRFGGRVIRQENAYLGAARNTAARAGTGEFLIFLDDDDLAFGHLVSTLVRAALLTGSDVINCPNYFMEEHRRREGVEALEEFDQKLSFFPLGGPLSLGTQQNVFGSATALIRRDAYDRIDGYTELRGVGYEDFEFMLKVAQTGGRIEICPEPLYLYEVDRPSMISQTSPLRNYRRILSARDIMPNDRAIRDLLSVTAGKRANEDLENRQIWEAKISANSDVLSGLLQSGTNHSLAFELLSDYADRIDAGRMKRTWASLTSPGERKEQAEPHRTERTKLLNLPVQTEETIDDVATTVLSLALIDRPEDALTYLEKKLDDLPYLTDVAMEWFAVLSAPLTAAKGTAFDKLCQLFLTLQPSHTDAGSIIAKAASFANGSAKLMPLVLAEIADRYGQSERAYREIYTEVDEAIEVKGLLPDAMEHYKRHGYAEGREGFEEFKIAAELISRSGTAVAPWEIARSFGFDNFQQLAASVSQLSIPAWQDPVSEVQVA